MLLQPLPSFSFLVLWFHGTGHIPSPSLSSLFLLYCTPPHLKCKCFSQFCPHSSVLSSQAVTEGRCWHNRESKFSCVRPFAGNEPRMLCAQSRIMFPRLWRVLLLNLNDEQELWKDFRESKPKERQQHIRGWVQHLKIFWLTFTLLKP